MASNPFNFDTTKGPLFGRIMIFVLPLAAIYLLERFVSCMDMAVVGRYAGGVSSLAAIVTSEEIYSLIRIPITGIACGALVTVAQYRGAGDDRGLSRAIHTSLVLALVFGLVLMSAGLILARPLLMSIKVPDDLIDRSTLYLRLLLLAFPFTAVATVCCMLMYGLGDTLWPLFVLLISGMVGMALNFVFVAVLRMDVAGVALATLISQMLAAPLLLLILFVFKGPERILWSKIRIHAREFGMNAAVGVPVMFYPMAFASSNIVIAARINTLGSCVIAGNAAAAQVESLGYGLFVSGMGLAAMVSAGQNFGAERYERVRKSTLVCMLTVTVALAVSVSIGLIFGEQLVGTISSDREVVEQAMKRLYLTLPAYLLLGLSEVATRALIGLGRWWAAVAYGVKILGGCVVSVIWVEATFKLSEFHSLRDMLIYRPVSAGIVYVVNGAIFFLVIGALIRKRRRAGSEESL